jgi:hypothetical protein
MVNGSILASSADMSQVCRYLLAGKSSMLALCTIAPPLGKPDSINRGKTVLSPNPGKEKKQAGFLL